MQFYDSTVNQLRSTCTYIHIHIYICSVHYLHLYKLVEQQCINHWQFEQLVSTAIIEAFKRMTVLKKDEAYLHILFNVIGTHSKKLEIPVSCLDGQNQILYSRSTRSLSSTLQIKSLPQGVSSSLHSISVLRLSMKMREKKKKNTSLKSLLPERTRAVWDCRGKSESRPVPTNLEPVKMYSKCISWVKTEAIK